MFDWPLCAFLAVSLKTKKELLCLNSGQSMKQFNYWVSLNNFGLFKACSFTSFKSATPSKYKLQKITENTQANISSAESSLGPIVIYMIILLFLIFIHIIGFSLQPDYYYHEKSGILCIFAKYYFLSPVFQCKTTSNTELPTKKYQNL